MTPTDAPGAPWIHASCVLIGAAGVLIRGAPGSGKSTLTLALMARESERRPARLVADDQVALVAAHGRLVARAPAAIAGRIEVRGAGLIAVAAERRAVVRLVVDLVADAQPERLPGADAARAEVAGLALPRLALAAGRPCQADRVLAALGVAAMSWLPSE